MIGIYCIKNNINGKEYIGQSVNIQRRITDHKSRAFSEGHNEYNSPLHQAIRKYGWSNFTVTVEKECLPEDLNYWEAYFIETKNTIAKNGYNISSGNFFIVDGEVHYPIKIHQQTLCSCGAPMDIKAKQCIECYKKEVRSNSPVYNINLFELIDRCLTNGLSQTGRELGYTSGASIVKFFKKNQIPHSLNELFQYYEELTGNKHPVEVKRLETMAYKKKRPTPKPVKQFDLEGNYIATFQSLYEASKISGVHSGHISECMVGKRKRAGNFIWKPLDKE